MRRFRPFCLYLTGLLCTFPIDEVLARPAPKEVAAPKESLHERIKTAVDTYAQTRAQTPVEPLKALMDEAEADPKVDPKDYAAISLIYGYRLGHRREFNQGLEVLDRAIARLKAAGLEKTHDMGQLLLAQAILRDQNGDLEGGLKAKFEALALYQSLGPDYRSMVATTKVQLGFTLFARGRVKEAMVYYDEGLDLMADDADVVASYALQMANLASAKRLVGDLNGSLDVGYRALEVARTRLPEGHIAKLYALYNLGTTLMELGRFHEAEDMLRQATDLAAQYRGKNSPEAIAFAFRLAQDINRQGRSEDAASLLLSAKDNLAGVKLGANADLPAQINLELSDIYMESGDLVRAEILLGEGLGLTADLGQIGDTTRAALYTRRAELKIINHDYSNALTDIDLALAYYERELPLESPLRASATTLKGLIMVRMGQAEAGLELIRPTYTAMRQHLGDIHLSLEAQREISFPYIIAFARIADIALAAKDKALGFEAAQYAAFSEVSATAQGLASKTLIHNPETLTQYDELHQKRALRQRLKRQRAYVFGKSDTEVALLDGEIAATESAIVKLSDDLAKAFPHFRSLSQPRVFSLEETQQDLSQKEAILIPIFTDDTTLSLSITRKGIHIERTPLSRTGANRAVQSIRLSVQSDDFAASKAFDLDSAYTLGSALLGPQTRKALKSTDTIKVLGAGPIMTIPFSLLVLSAPEPTNDKGANYHATDWLIKHYAVVIKPALTVASLAQTQSSAQGWFFGIGAPELNPKHPDQDKAEAIPFRGGGEEVSRNVTANTMHPLQELPNAKDELNRMKEALALNESQILTGAQATETAIKTLPKRRYEVIAFATHGLLQGEVGSTNEPALVLTPPAHASLDDDGLLTASEVASLSLDAKWVILSACNTGSGREAGAAGYSGLASAFMQAGAESLLVSLWPVRDDVADRLSVDTVRLNARGVTKPKSLQKAILKLMKDRTIKDSANPAVWAPFSLITR